jgi:hypothetical protein
MKNYFADHKRGDTFNGRKISLERNGAPIDLTGAKIIIQFKLSSSGVSKFEFSTKKETIYIPEPTNGELIMMPRILNVPAGHYNYDMQITFPNGNVKTYLSGIWTILDDVSR